MTDRREQILARIATVLDSVSSGLYVERNAPNVPPDSRPIAVLYDGNEESEPSDPNRGGAAQMRRVRMSPDIIIAVSAPAGTVGTELNALRASIVHALLTDATLLALSLNSEGVIYQGAQQMVEDGRRVEGAMLLQFDIVYRLLPSELAA